MSQLKTKTFTLSTIEAGSGVLPRLALVLPGRLETKDYIHIRSHVDYLAGLGYHALAFDPPGSWGSAGSIEQYTVTNYLAAVNELIDYYGNKPTILIGHSLGGSVAMLAAARNPSITGFVSLMAVIGRREPDQEWETQGKIPFFRDLPPGDSPTQPSEQKRFDLPYSYFKDAQQYDTAAAIQSCTKPKLFVMGTYDTQTTPDRVQYTFEIAAPPKRLVVAPCGHGYRYSKLAIQEINKLLGEFITSLTPTPDSLRTLPQ